MAEPKVRFTQNDGNSYPDWKEGKLGNITERVDRKASKGSTAPIMMVSQGNGFIYQADKYSRENAGESLKNYTLLKQGEFAYNHGASKAKPYGVAYCLTEEAEARVPFVYHTFRMVEGINAFWHEALNTCKMDRKLKRMVSSGARMDGLLNINYETYMDVDVNIPCLEEQQKIADFLLSVDEVIVANEAEVQNLETQKKAVMQKIFSQEVRFKKGDGTDYPEWEDKKLGDIGTVLMCKRVFKDQTESKGDIPFYKIGTFGGIPDAFISRELFETLRTRYSYPQKGNILISAAGTIGRAVIFNGEDAYYQDSNIVWLDHDDTITDEFLYHFYSMTSWDNLEGGTVKRLYNGILLDKNISIPCLEEQNMIAGFLSDFDEAITAAKKELETWKKLKEGLLQLMFV